MWLATTRGFYSAVEDWDNPKVIRVRARVRADLERLDDLVKGGVRHRIERDAQADYLYRVELTRAEWMRVCALLATELDYPNFKNAVTARQGGWRASVYHRVWAVLISLERGRYSYPDAGGQPLTLPWYGGGSVTRKAPKKSSRKKTRRGRKKR